MTEGGLGKAGATGVGTGVDDGESEGVGVGAASDGLVIDAVLAAAELCDVTAYPRRIDVPSASDTVEFAMGVHVTPPSFDFAEVYVLPVRDTRRLIGVTPVTCASWTAVEPVACRYCTLMPFPGVT